MSKDISIIIPRYKETEHDIFPLLSSINIQVGVSLDDFEIIIVNDGDGAGTLDENFLQLFDFSTKQISLEENRGPGVARQVGLDAAKGDYVLFCDADDTLHSVGVLGAMLQEVKTNAPDILRTSWLEELVDKDGNHMYITHEIENTWMHGKLIRRGFLRQHNVRFHNELRVHEDSYFLCIAKSFCERDRYLPITSYVWKYHEQSITRRNNAIYTYESFPTFIRACICAYNELEGKNPYELAQQRIVQFVLYIYFTLHVQHWSQDSTKEYRDMSEQTFIEEIAPYWHYWDEAPKPLISTLYNEERQKGFANEIETETLDQWLSRIREEE